MTAAWLWVRADLRRRWRSWVVLGLLAGVSAGLAAAGVAGARRTDRVVPNYAAASNLPDAAVLANDFAYDERKRAEVAALPEVVESFPFAIPFMLQAESPEGYEAPLLPASEAAMSALMEPLVAGRAPDPARADEIVVNENVKERFHLDLGATVTFVQPDPAVDQTLRVVGIMKSTDKELNSMPSSGFYEKYREQFAEVAIINEFVDLRHGEDRIDAFRSDVEAILGHPVNVERISDLFGIDKLLGVGDVEQGGLYLFALAVALGAGVLVGQALVRAVSAGAADLPTWRSLGADRGIVVRALVAPTLVTALTAAVTTIGVAVALSPRFPIALSRRFDLDLGVHADWTVLGGAALAVVLLVLLAAWGTAELRLRRGEGTASRRPLVTRATSFDMPPALLLGSRLAIEPGQGRRAVPVRSALVGAIVGVIGVVGCLTFRAGLADTVNDARRSGVVWDHIVAASDALEAPDVRAIVDDDAVAAVESARWARAVPVDGKSTTAFGTSSLKGDVDFVMVSGRAPRGVDELAIGPSTAADLGLGIGDRAEVGEAGRSMRVVGIALLPASSHTDYDQSLWMTNQALDRVIPPADELAGSGFIEDYVLIRWREGADIEAAEKRANALVERGLQRDLEYYSAPAELPSAVNSLGELRSLPFALAIFFALLASATVAHALVTTVRRRGHDLAIFRSIGITRRDTRLAIAWQSTLLALAGLVVGVPLGIVVGRALWQQLAENFPVLYVPPLALAAVLLVVPVAISIANLLAAGPAHAAARLRPADALRTE